MIDNTFKVVKELGSGVTANVKLVEHSRTGKLYACKIMKESSPLIELVENEVNIVTSLNNQNIYKILGARIGKYEEKKVVYILSEYASNGELFDLISSTKGFSEDVARYYFVQILNTINYLHNKKKICHRDIKPENIFVDQKFNLKFGDFGFATSIKGNDGKGYFFDYCGTPLYMPPEQHLLNTYTGKATDLFASAVVLFTMVTECQPFALAVPEDEYYKLIVHGSRDTYWKIFEKDLDKGLTPEFKDLIFGMLQLDPKKRYDISQILAHPWIKNGPHLHNDDVAKYMLDNMKTIC